MAKRNPAYQGIEQVDEDWLSLAMKASPHYGLKVASALSRTIRCIHGLQKLHGKSQLSELEVYVGRATITTLKHRWAKHAAGKRGHRYGVILFCCNHDRVERLEDLAIRILDKLRDRKLLCVANANKWPGNKGRKPRAEEALVYMTWRYANEEFDFYARPTIDQLREVSKEVHQETRDVHQETDRKITRKQISNGVRMLKRLTAKDPLYWWHPS
ncbi:MAG: hypothetical protein AABY47_09650 [Pseudomonadota bacterium]|jgi:hypothetical protein